MPQPAELPNRLYKYKKFDYITLDMLVMDRLYFANPATFNDPLDTRPSVNGDMSATELETLVGRLFEARIEAEMTAAAKSIKYRGPKTLIHIAQQSARRRMKLLSEIAYNATNPDYEIDDPHKFLLTQPLESELLKRYDRGIVSLTEVADCPLMWSHYGDQHNGVCIGYSLPPNREMVIRPIEYGGSREVAASDIEKMLNDDPDARKRVDQAVLFRKAKPWKYEHEWRLIADRGLQDSPLELEEIVFGLRCGEAVVYAVVKALQGRGRPVSFFEMREVRGTFGLTKSPLDVDEALAQLPRRCISYLEAFEEIAEEQVVKPPA